MTSPTTSLAAELENGNQIGGARRRSARRSTAPAAGLLTAILQGSPA